MKKENGSKPVPGCPGINPTAVASLAEDRITTTSVRSKKKGHFTELVRAEQISHCPEMLLFCQGILNNNPPIHHAADVSVGIF